MAKLLALYHNRTNETAAELDIDLLIIELGELREAGANLKLLGFTDTRTTLGWSTAAASLASRWNRLMNSCTVRRCRFPKEFAHLPPGQWAI